MNNKCAECDKELEKYESLYYDVPAGSKRALCQACFDKSATIAPTTPPEVSTLDAQLECAIQLLRSIQAELASLHVQNSETCPG